MFHFAFSRGQGPVYEDLPPTLQPCAVAHAAPSTDHLRTAALSGLIYALLGGSLAVIASLAPTVVLAPAPPIQPGRTVIIEGPSMPRLIERIITRTGGVGGSVLSSLPPTAPPSRPDPPDSAPAALSTEDHRGDVPAVGLLPTGPQTSVVGPAPSTVIGPAVHDYTSTGLAVLRQVDPIYPDFARQARIQGPVVLRLTVDEQGRPIQVQVLEGHPVFHEAALQAARQWRFEPARMDGRAVSASFRLTLKFSLR